MNRRFSSFSEFYPFYLEEHSNRISRALHFAGTSLVLILLVWLLKTGSWSQFYLLPLCGYGFAWAGHFFFEKNRPATFRHPFYSLAADFVMWKDMLTGKIKF